MRLYYNLLALFAFICTISAATVDYTKNGVLRIDDNKCNINFVNFGIGDTIKDIKVSFANKVLTIENLKNGNEGQNNASFNKDDIVKYIIVTQGNVEKDYTVTKYKDGLFSISIKDINSCNEVTVKQTYKYDVLMYSYLLYANKIPNPINTSFPTDQFGPSSNDQPYDKLYWDMNKGLDELREKCRIYIDYKRREYGGSWHYVWYLSTETINKDNCSNADFYEIVRKHYPKYNTMYELFGDYYEGYVMKRESGSVAHMDGIINSKYIIEVYQEACGIQSDNQVICTISSEEKLKFDDFTDELMKNCLSIIVDKDEVGKWSANKSNVKAQFENYSIKVENNGEGTLPTSEDGVVGYKTFKANNSSGVARFKVSLVCNDGTYRDNKCRCKACSLGCKLCTGPDQCTECKHGNLTNGQCICDAGYFMNIDGNCQKCGDDCKTCKNAETCDSCIDPIKELKDGKCVCPANSTLKNGKCECDAGYFMNKEGKCSKCGVDCKTCKNAETCDSCIDPIKELKDGRCECPANSTLKSGKCECDAGYFMNNDGKCSKCGVDCKTCKDAETCDSCIDPIKELKDGKCECPANSTLKNGKCECDTGYFMNNDGKCSKCGDDCKTCSENAETCDSCIDPIKELKDGRCVCPANSTLKNGKCECDAGYFMNNDGKCSKCGDDCKTCSENAESCDSCYEPKVLNESEKKCECPPNSTLKEGKCECNDGFFMKEGNCEECGDDCETCKDAETCDSCFDPVKELKNGKCVCPANSTLKSGKCECDDGYFMNNDGKCSKCGNDCKTCSENAESCDSCYEPKILNESEKRCECPPNSTLKEGKCICDDGYYMDEGECKVCGPDCKTCENANTCTECANPKKKLNNGKCECKENHHMNNEGQCICDEGFYAENNECVACVGDCKTCKSATYCEKCHNELKIAVDGVCKCIDGYYMKEGKCEKCKPGCVKCTENECLECEGEGRVPGEDGQCVCGKSYYEDYETHECNSCGVSCATCNKKGKCTSCKDTRAFISDGVCVCKYSALNEDGYCIICDKSCAECDAHGCVTCADPTKTPDENGKC